MVRTYRELVAWQKGMALVKAVYALAKQFPKAEQYRLVDQLTRAAVSVPSNVAEGFGRATGQSIRIIKTPVKTNERDRPDNQRDVG